MATSTLLAPSSDGRKFKTVLWTLLGLTTLFVFITSEVFLFADYPMYHAYRLQVIADRHLLIPHVLFGSIALLSGPLQFSSRFRQRHLQLHRVLGRVYVISVFLSAPTGVILSEGRPGFPGTSMQALAWVVCTAAAFVTARNRQIPQHRQWMARSYAVTFTFVSSRVLNLWPRYWSHLGDSLSAVGVIAATLLSLLVVELGLNWRELTTQRARGTDQETPLKTPSSASVVSDSSPFLQSEVLVLGGGVAGCAAAIALARKGRGVTLIERELTSRHKVCGEFLSSEALEYLHALGVNVYSLGAVPIDRVRLAAGRRAAEAPLPFPAASLTRKALDTELIQVAIAAGVRVERGRSVQSLDRTTGHLWQVTLDDGTIREAPTVFLATGKHDLRGHRRAEDPERWVAFKMYFRLAPAQAVELERASELMLYPGGYGGIQPIEGNIANLCWVVQQKYLARVGHRWERHLANMKQHCPHLAMRLAGAEPLLAKPVAIAHIPYGFVRRETEEGLFCIGDQAAVIPSFTGDGISIALHTAHSAVAAQLAAEPAPVFQAKLRSALLPQMRLAVFAADALNNALARAVLPFCLRIWPGVMRLTATLTRVTQPAATTTHSTARLVPRHEMQQEQSQAKS